jgi:hypothetical protein
MVGLVVDGQVELGQVDQVGIEISVIAGNTMEPLRHRRPNPAGTCAAD